MKHLRRKKMTVCKDCSKFSESSSLLGYLNLQGGYTNIFFSSTLWFHIPRHSRGLQSIIFTLTESVPELGLLIMILIISGLIFASLTYYIEMVQFILHSLLQTPFFRTMIPGLQTSLHLSTGSSSQWPQLGKLRQTCLHANTESHSGMAIFFQSLDLGSWLAAWLLWVELSQCPCLCQSLSAILRSRIQLRIETLG